MRRSSRVLLVVSTILGALLLGSLGLVALLAPRPVETGHEPPAVPAEERAHAASEPEAPVLGGHGPGPAPAAEVEPAPEPDPKVLLVHIVDPDGLPVPRAS